MGWQDRTNRRESRGAQRLPEVMRAGCVRLRVMFWKACSPICLAVPLGKPAGALSTEDRSPPPGQDRGRRAGRLHAGQAGRLPIEDDARAGIVDEAGLQIWCREATKRFKNVSLIIIIIWAEGPNWVVARIGDHMMQKRAASGAVVH